jgi:uncharacterized membrane-anchored protein YhcB (DUF1043 family)
MTKQFINVLKPYLPAFVLEIDPYHLIRLVIIITGYIVVRNAVSKYLANRQLQQQLDKDASERDVKKIRELVDDPSIAETSGVDDNTWGFGKKTRKVVKRQQKILQEQLETAHLDVDDDDKDIEYLLED